ncbi:hypothetical protein F4V43_04140 [Paenibacillus spiritus]|uniref:Uncharacterized protein n=1 Tax=Paenibacillus spiritus TaxID=2496557 RepID=A0A5J5GHH5_9BACL|nr:hypothetical protein [Paenibacillus spiritus]KAA9007679.1 hypothetical protein F4V43_04140 [Paenibacillus spiritus]
MNRAGKKIAVLGLWIGIGVLVGMQFGGGKAAVSSPVPGYRVLPAGNQPAAAAPAAGTGAVTGYRVEPDGGGGYLYIPVTLLPSGSAGAAGTAAAGTGSSGAGTAVSPESAKSSGGQTVLPDPGGGGLPSGKEAALTPGQILVPEAPEPPVDVLADKTAGLLQDASRAGIRWIVSLFDSGE